MGSAPADVTAPAGTGRPGRPRSRRSRLSRLSRPGAVPVVLALLAAVVLVALGLNGSSLGALQAPGTSDPALLAGAPRVIRVDEYGLSTPNLIGNVRRGLPVRPWVGLTRTFLPASSIGVPSAHWTALFRPYDLGLFVLSPDRGFAAHWWALLLIGFLGSYALLWRITRAPAVAAGTAALVTFAPVTAWWSLTPALVVGSLAGTSAALMAAANARRILTVIGLGMLGGYLTVVAFLFLYPPWLVSVALVAVAAWIGWLVDSRAPLRQAAIGAAAAAAVAVPALTAWYLQGRAAIDATAATFYPGNRISPPGGGDLDWLLGAPSSLWLSDAHPLVPRSTAVSATGGRLISNATELAAPWFPLPVLAVVAVVAGWVLLSRRRAATLTPAQPPAPSDATPSDATASDATPSMAGAPDDPGPVRPVWTTVAVLAVTVLLLGWALLPLPAFVGALTLLDRVPGQRLSVALGLATAVLLAGSGALLRGHRVPSWLYLLTGLGGVATVAAVTLGVRGMHWTHGRPSSLEVAAVATVLATGAALLACGRLTTVASLGLGALALAVFVPVNPLYRGLGPLDTDPVVKALTGYVHDGSAPRTAVYGGIDLNALVTASGVQDLSGLTPYPDAAVWARLVPAGVKTWNSYAKYLWTPDLSSATFRIASQGSTEHRLYVNPCAADTRSLGIDLTVSATPIAAPCLTLLRTIDRGGSAGAVYLYRYTSAGAGYVDQYPSS